MDLEIITERESSPFRHIFPEKGTNGRRYGMTSGMPQVIQEFLERLRLQRDISTLEIGAGHEQEPTRALVELGARAVTLDADWNMQCTSLPTIEDLERIGDAELYPMLVGRNGRDHYLGDIAFINHERSQLKGRKFDLAFYWGSIHGTNMCSSVAISETALESGINIPLQERLIAPVSNVAGGGYLACVSSFFNNTGDPPMHPLNVTSFNGMILDVLLSWTSHEGRKPAKALVFGLTPKFSFEYLEKSGLKECAYEIAREEIEEAVNNDTIRSFMENHWSMFSRTGDSSDYRRALSVFTPAQQKAISDLGIIDCVAVQYR